MAAAMAIANETNMDLVMINKIKQHQVLYDTDEDQYKYIDKRDKAWKEVADELGMPGKYDDDDNKRLIYNDDDVIHARFSSLR